MPYYECVMITRQDISSSQVETLAATFSSVIADNGGTVASTEFWGLRSLTYRIKKNRKGHYVLFNLDSPPEAVKELERQMGIHEDILRFMTVRVEALEEGPSAMMQQRPGRDGRDGRGDRRDRRDRGDRPDRGDRGDRGDRPDRGDRGDRPDRGERSDRGDRAAAPAPAG